MDMPFLTIITPTYNRADRITNLYNSLKKQKNTDYLWLIIDDGSEDNTREIVEKWIENSTYCVSPNIKYIYKKNGGKHTALNVAFKELETELAFIVDSDDYLTEDAVDVISGYCGLIRENNLSGISFLRGYDEKKIIGDSFPIKRGDYLIGNDNYIRVNRRVSGDKAEVWRSDILKQYSFPVYEREKFMGEDYIWKQIAFDYDMLFVNKIIYVTEYLQGGLTKSGRALRVRCPKGGMDNSRIGMDIRFPLLYRLKKAMLYDSYAYFTYENNTKIREYINLNGLTRLMQFPGAVLFRIWNQKYGKENIEKK